MACRGSGVRVPPAPPPQIGQVSVVPRRPPFVTAEADGDVVGNVLVSVERSVVSDHVGTLSICVADGWREVGIGSALVEAAKIWAAERGLAKVALGVFPDNLRAIAVYEHAGFEREGLRRRQYRVPGGEYRDEL